VLTLWALKTAGLCRKWNKIKLKLSLHNWLAYNGAVHQGSVAYAARGCNRMLRKLWTYLHTACQRHPDPCGGAADTVNTAPAANVDVSCSWD
jgi:hypothetical protein